MSIAMQRLFGQGRRCDTRSNLSIAPAQHDYVLAGNYVPSLNFIDPLRNLKDGAELPHPAGIVAQSRVQLSKKGANFACGSNVVPIVIDIFPEGKSEIVVQMGP